MFCMKFLCSVDWEPEYLVTGNDTVMIIVSRCKKEVVSLWLKRVHLSDLSKKYFHSWPSPETRQLTYWDGSRQAHRHYSNGGQGGMNVFDRKAKRLQKNRAAVAPDAATYDYLKDEVASQIVDRVCDISRFFQVALDVGCGRGHIAKHVSDDLIGSLYQCDIAEEAVVSGLWTLHRC